MDDTDKEGSGRCNWRVAAGLFDWVVYLGNKGVSLDTLSATLRRWIHHSTMNTIIMEWKLIFYIAVYQYMVLQYGFMNGMYFSVMIYGFSTTLYWRQQ